jgi:hypothetical protein
MANYSTVAAVDTFALTVNDVGWLSSDSKEMTALINFAGGYTAAAVSIAFDALDSASGIEQYDVLKINDEYLRVDAITYATTTTGIMTVTRAFYGSTAAAISDDDTIYVKNQRKGECLNKATDDLVAMHGQTLFTDELWLDGEERLIEAENRQTLWISKYLEERESSQRIAQLTAGSYSDGAVSIDPVTSASMDPRARAIVRQVMRDNEVIANAFQRG